MDTKQLLAGSVPFWLTAYNVEVMLFPAVYVVVPLFLTTLAVVAARKAWAVLGGNTWSPQL